MDKTNDGGQAFPQSVTTLNRELSGGLARETLGMSLRDWFAGQFLAGVATARIPPSDVPTHESVATAAYTMADAMLAARQK